MSTSGKPLVHIGWLGTHDGRDATLESAYQQGAQLLEERLEKQFSMFSFRVEALTRRRYAGQGMIDPIDLLEIGLHEKTMHHWDYALILTPNELIARKKAFMLGAPSSALETAVMSTLWFRNPDIMPAQLSALGSYFLGHMWGLPTREEGAMVPPASAEDLSPLPFTEDECHLIIARLKEVADARLEDQAQTPSRLAFLWQTLRADPKSIATDIIGYRPWQQPLQLGGLTAAAFVTTLLLFLGAEAWELGVHANIVFLLVGALVSVIGSALFLYHGQNLGQLARRNDLTEQLERARMILFACLTIGMATLWLILFASAFAVSMALPREVLAGWLGNHVGPFQLARFATFAATLGVAAGALGGNLEDEGAMKAKFFFDEET